MITSDYGSQRTYDHLLMAKREVMSNTIIHANMTKSESKVRKSQFFGRSPSVREECLRMCLEHVYLNHIAWTNESAKVFRKEKSCAANYNFTTPQL